MKTDSLGESKKTFMNIFRKCIIPIVYFMMFAFIVGTSLKYHSLPDDSSNRIIFGNMELLAGLVLVLHTISLLKIESLEKKITELGARANLRGQ